MKTTIDISDDLLARAKELSAREGTTLKDLAEEGLELVIERHTNRSRACIRPVVVDGAGLSDRFRGASWAEIRAEIYGGETGSPGGPARGPSE